MKNKEKLNILILRGLLFLSGCGASDVLQPYEENDISAEEPEEENISIEETETAQESEAVSEEAEQWTDTFYVPADELQGNYLGYSFIRLPRTATVTYYEQDMPYLLDEDMVGKGIYISDYMCETEVFLGSILKDVVANRGAVSDENRQYFTEYALLQLADTDWKLLDAEWEPDLYIYDRYYEMNPVSGGGRYRFFYYFYPNQEEIRKEEPEEETNKVNIMLYVDGSGRICEITTDISVELARLSRIEEGISTSRLFDDDYNEQIIKDGSPCHEDMVWDFEWYFRRFMYPSEVYEQDNEGLLASGYAYASAENLADIFLHVMGNRGADVEKYEDWFEYDKYFSNFADADWESLGEDWIVDEEYDCLFIDRISYGWVNFQFYFYPDFDSMEIDEAKMVVIDCNIDTSYGVIWNNSIDIFSISKEECREIKQKQTESRILVVEKGTVLSGNTKVAIPVLERKVEYMLISEFDPGTVAVEHSSREVKEEIWGFTDAAEAGDYLAQKFLKDFDENNVWKGEINSLNKDKSALYDALFAIELFMEDGWKPCGEYDCFYVKSNEAEGCMHLQYYFYPERTSEEQSAKTLVIDVYFSEEGIEYMGVNQFSQ